MLLTILTFVKHLAFLLENEPFKGRGLALLILKSLDIQETLCTDEHEQSILRV